MAAFSRIAAIDPAQEETWRDKLFLTIDVDWASDPVFADTIDVIEAAGVEATWFITHDTPLLARLRDNSRFELGLHPNFNFLLDGRADNGADRREVLQRIQDVVPEARSVRSHSVTQSTLLLDLFVEAGLTHDCNHFIPFEAGIALKPWADWTRIAKIPYLWEDDIAFARDQAAPIVDVAASEGLRVFDFHPIHIFLNTEAPARYAAARPHLRDAAAIEHHVNRGGARGTRDWLDALIGLA